MNKTIIISSLIIDYDRGARATTLDGGNISFFDAIIYLTGLSIFSFLIAWIGAGIQKSTDNIKKIRKEKEIGDWEKKIEEKWKRDEKHKRYDYFQKNKTERANLNINEGYDYLDIYTGMDMYEDEISIDIEWTFNRREILEREKQREANNKNI